jgi:hypothetical protein
MSSCRLDQHQDDVNTIEHQGQTAIQRSGTLDMLEKGVHHVTQDSWVQYGFSYATSVQQVFSKSTGSKPGRNLAYTLRQAFFVAAGGLAVETKSFHKEPYLTVTPTGAVELARLGLLTPVPEDVINDKTKADLITKLVVCVQAGWFIVQCIARVAQHLPLSLLEIHVLTHVFVALLMYLFWFAKPYDVASPVVVTEPKVIEAVALFTLAQRNEWADGFQTTERCVLTDGLPIASDENNGHTQSSAIEKKKLMNDGPILPHDEYVGTISAFNGERDDAYCPSDVAEQASRNYQANPANGMDGILKNTTQSHVRHRNRLSSPTTLPSSHHGQSRGLELSDDTHLCIQPQAAHQSSITDAPDNGSQLDGHSSSGLPTSTDRQGRPADTALMLAQLAIQRLKSLNMHLTYFVNDETDIRFRSTYVVRSIHDFNSNPGFDFSRTEYSNIEIKSQADYIHERWSLALLLFMPYAAFHLSAWNAHFPTPVERWLWRGAGLLMFGTPILVECLARIPDLIDWVDDARIHAPRWVKVVCSPVFSFLRRATFVCYFLVLLTMEASRLYFFVEAFISLRDPAPRTYETVKWIQYWPHL